MAIDVVSSHPHSPSVPRRCRSNSSANCSGVTLRMRPKADISHASIVPIRPYLQTLRPHGFGMTHTILQIIAQLSVRSWDNGWDNRRGSTRDRIALKRRQRNDLVGFELFFRSQTLYPTELRARGYTVYFQQFSAVSCAISTSRVSAFASH